VAPDRAAALEDVVLPSSEYLKRSSLALDAVDLPQLAVVHSDPSEALVGAALLDDVVLPGAESVPRQSAVRDVVDLTQLPVEGQEDAPAPSREDAQEDDISNAVTKGIRELEDVPFSKWTVNIDPLRHSIHKKRRPKRKITVKASSSTMD
jgi:hypothetical protein